MKKKSSVGKPRKRWFDDVEKRSEENGYNRGWRKTSRDRDAWK